MKFKNQLEATILIKRYKRFLADVVHPQKGEITVYCPNTGSMKNCWQAGWTAWLLENQNPKRKYSYTWVLTENDQGNLIGIDSSFANDIVYEALIEGKIKELAGFTSIEREVKYGNENSRIDILLTGHSQNKNQDQNKNQSQNKNQKQNIYIEVKSVTLLDESGNSIDEKKHSKGQGFFPDAVTLRGQKHIRELISCVAQGHRAVLFFLVQHSAIKQVSIAQHIDPDYAELVQLALDSGVEILVYNTKISQLDISLDKKIKFK